MKELIKTLRKKMKFRLMYRKKPRWDSGITPPEVIEFLETHTPGRAIDLGCGTGTNVLTLAEYGWQATGIDFTPKAIRQARRKARHAKAKVKFTIGDVTNGSLYDGPYDLILDIGCYHALPLSQRSRYRKNVLNHLAPGGDYLLYIFTEQLFPEDIAAFQKKLTLTKRKDKYNPNRRDTSWLWFKSQES